jgi:formylglycine-generating enzyme required for sulfatase activity
MLLVLCTASVGDNTQSQHSDQYRIAILEFHNRAGMPTDEKDYLTDAVVRGRVRRILPGDRFSVMNKENMISILDDLEINYTEACEGDCEVDIGRKIQAHFIITGNIWKVDRVFKLIVKLYETVSGNLASQETAQGSSVSEIEPSLAQAVARLLEPLVPSSEGGPVFIHGVPGASGPSKPEVSDIPASSRVKADSGPAVLYITSDPPGADVYLGSIIAGNTDPAFQKADLKPGTTLTVTLKKEMYHPLTFEVPLERGITRYENLTLKPAFGTLIIKSDPSGAEIELSGRSVGRTTYENKNIASGQYLVNLSLPLYEPVLNDVVAVEDGRVTEKSYTLTPAYGTLSIDSSPDGAQITVTGLSPVSPERTLGRTPLTEVKLSPGTFKITLSLEGFRQREYKITIARARETRIDGTQAVLQKKEGTINVLVDPPEPGTVVYLDKKERGTAPLTIEHVTAGEHVVEARSSGKEGSKEVILDDGETETIVVSIKEKAVEGQYKSRYRTDRSHKKDYRVNLGDGVFLEMVYIQGGTFEMGSRDSEKERDNDEGPVHNVKLSPFYIGKFEVTQAQWKTLMDSNRSRFEGDNRPVESITWEEAKEFCRKLSQKTGHIYRLPTEAEWEYACRGGTSTPFHTGACLSTDQANYNGNYPYTGCAQGKYRKKTIDVGSFESNSLGLYDMHGNVWEWCADWYDANYYRDCARKGTVIDPAGPNSGSDRVDRGGCWGRYARNCRSANRDRLVPTLRSRSLGFRLARTP